MSLVVEWEPSAEENLRGLPSWRDAETVVIAVHRFAELGEGRLEVGAHLDELRLSVGPFVAVFITDRPTSRIIVTGVFRRK